MELVHGMKKRKYLKTMWLLAPLRNIMYSVQRNARDLSENSTHPEFTGIVTKREAFRSMGLLP